MTKLILALAAVALVAAVASATVSDVRAQGLLPPGPYVFFGSAAAAGQPVPDGYAIHAVVGAYASEPVTVSSGRYYSLTVDPPAGTPGNQNITFMIGGTAAAQTFLYQARGFPTFTRDFNLTFATLPAPTPTPTPEGGPAPTATPTEPTATPTPAFPDPMNFTIGLILLTAGGGLPEGAQLTARIGESYVSEPAQVFTVDGQHEYAGLMVDPKDNALIGQNVEFYIDGKAARTTEPFESGGLRGNFDIVFTVLLAQPTPTPAPTATPTPVPPTPTATPEPTPTPAVSVTTAGDATLIQGASSAESGRFDLRPGVAVFEITHRGSDRFSVDLLDANGARVRRLAAAAGGYNGKVGIGVNAAATDAAAPGSHTLAVIADGDWTARLTQPQWTSGSSGANFTFTGPSDDVIDPILLLAGRLNVTMSHQGSGEFIVLLIAPDGTVALDLADQRGVFNGVSSVSVGAGGAVQPGPHGMFVTADGPWTITAQVVPPSTPTPVPQPTAVPATAPQPTPVPGAPQPAPGTALQPTPVPAAAAAPTPTTRARATATPPPQDSGGCASPGPTTPRAAAANIILLLAPLALIASVRHHRRHHRRRKP